MSEKNYYTIGEIKEKTGLPEHTLRYWEERKLLKPLRQAGSGHRRYTRIELAKAVEIKTLLEKGYTIAGIKKKLQEQKRKTGNSSRIPSLKKTQTDLLEEIYKELTALIKEL